MWPAKHVTKEKFELQYGSLVKLTLFETIFVFITLCLCSYLITNDIFNLWIRL